ncbi:hypothetical protein [Phocoenobacter skyensis]|uniref:Uncharacterized protein n=1 Tax=Phocoenobacter skyensis TaxID=97481 RepID=A0ABT9JIA6_9PAST|nr:hypothetical protein [Pasteurella skyensis]MDP8078368.1 hypothetical protein [Pasteurella skyensis]MDP8084540.1 hypothetical protein [Pasteurella skyensis]
MLDVDKQSEWEDFDTGVVIINRPLLNNVLNTLNKPKDTKNENVPNSRKLPEHS